MKPTNQQVHCLKLLCVHYLYKLLFISYLRQLVARGWQTKRWPVWRTAQYKYRAVGLAGLDLGSPVSVRLWMSFGRTQSFKLQGKWVRPLRQNRNLLE